MKALTESKPGGAIPQVNNMPHQQTLSRMARCRQTLRRWWPFYVMALPGVIYFFYLALFTHLGNQNCV